MNYRLFLYLFFLPFSFFGQDYSLKNITVRDDQNTYLITGPPFVDKDGFIWYAANAEGLFYKYDGKNKIKYSFHNNIPNNSGWSVVVYSWIQDANNTIWAITPSGAYLINPTTFKVDFIDWNIQYYELTKSYNIASLQDRKGNIWVSYGMSSVIKFDRNYKQTVYTNPDLLVKDRLQIERSDFDKQTSLKIVKELDNGSILAKTYSDIYLIDAKGIHFYANAAKFGIDFKEKLHFIENGTLFKRNSSGTFTFKGKHHKYRYIKELNLQLFNFPYDDFVYTASKLYYVDKNKIFINTVDSQKNALKTVDTIIFKKDILHNRLNIDRKSTITFSNYDNIYLLKTSNLRFKKHLQFNDKQVTTRGIVSDKKGNLYVGSHSGLYKINQGDKSIKKIYSPDYSFDYYNSLLIDSDSILWVTVDDNYVKSINLVTNEIKNRVFKNNANYRPLFLKEKSKDTLWLCTGNGLYLFDKKTGETKPYKHKDNGDKETYEYILETHDKDVWLASYQGLFYQKKGGKIIEYGKKNKFFSKEPILVLHEDENKNIWIGTKNKGVVMLDPKTGRMKVYNQSNGLSNNSVCGILESKNEFWFSTFFGLSSLNKKTGRFNNFYEQDGLPDNEFNKWSFYKKNDSTFYFGGLNGIVEFNPLKFKFQNKKSKIFLSKSEYFSKAKNKTVVDYLDIDAKRIQLPYNKNFFSAEFTLDDIYYNEKSSYYYKIEGLTEGWLNIGVSGVIKLYGLPAGNHVLLVKGKDFDGVETVNQIEIPIHVEQIFFKTPTFIVFVVLLILLFMVQQFKRKIRKQKNIFKREKEIITLKANALKAQMNPHFVFNIMNNMQSIMILKGEEEANKYFGAFSRLLRLTLDMSKQELVTLKDELDYINYYLLLNNLQLNDELDFSVVVDESIENKEDIFLPGMLIQPFVENAIIHGLTPKGGEKKITLNCSLHEAYLVVSIEDNGIGREASAMLIKNREFVYKSWSTTIVNERINVINATNKDSIILTIEDIMKEDKAAGTRVILKFKIR